MHSTYTEMGVNSVPAFLTKIWTLVEDSSTDELISWDPSGLSFHVHDQGRFAKEILPHYFKHSNIASFVRQLNMYGFKKVVHMDSGSIKRESDEVEFHHPYFIRGQENLLEHIKRKTSQGSGGSSTLKTEAGLKFSHDDVTRVLTDVQLMKGKQEVFNSKMEKIKKENEALWREVASLRQKHVKQQQIVNKLIQFMIHLVGGNRNPLSGSGLSKRKMPLMISDSSQVDAAKRPRYNNQISIEEVPDQQHDYVITSPDMLSTESPDLNYSTGPIIHEVVDIMDSPLTQSTSTSSSNIDPAQGNATSHQQLPTNAAADLLLPSTTEMSPDLNSSINSTDLNDLVQNIDNSLLDVSNTDNSNQATSSMAGPVDVLDKSQLNSQLDNLQFEIDNLKDMMTSEQFNFDLSTILPLFNPDNSSVPVSIENLLGELDTQQSFPLSHPTTSGSVRGNELVQFQSPADTGIPDLSDLVEYDNFNSPEEETETESIDPMSFINTVPVSEMDKCLNTPKVDQDLS